MIRRPISNSEKIAGVMAAASRVAIAGVGLAVAALGEECFERGVQFGRGRSGSDLDRRRGLFCRVTGERRYDVSRFGGGLVGRRLFGLLHAGLRAAVDALMMKARADDRRIFEGEARPHVLSLQESRGLDAAAITNALNEPISPRLRAHHLFEEIDEAETPLLTRKRLSGSETVSGNDVASLLALFEQAKTFGSLISVPPSLAMKLPELERRLDHVLENGDLMHASSQVLKPLVVQARLLAMTFDVVLANPPYMGSGYFNPSLKAFARSAFSESIGDLYSCFMVRNAAFAKPCGLIGMITIPNWMFLSTFRDLREDIFSKRVIASLVHNGRGVWGSDFGSCSFVIWNYACEEYRGSYRRLFEKPGSVASNEELQSRFFATRTYQASSLDFKKIPGLPVAFWATDRMRDCFATGIPLGDIAPARRGLATGDNVRFIRFWYEVSAEKLGLNLSREQALASEKKWFPYNKGGEFRKWFGNLDLVVNYEGDGRDIRSQPDSPSGERPWRVTSEECYFREGITWGGLTVASVSFRWCDAGMVFDTNKGPMMFPPAGMQSLVLGFLSSKVVAYCISLINPTVSTQNADINVLPFVSDESLDKVRVEEVVGKCIEIARTDWNQAETAFGFKNSPYAIRSSTPKGISDVFAEFGKLASDRLSNLQELETENNSHFIKAYGVGEDIEPTVPDDQITLYRPNVEEDIKRLLSYFVGCFMGRYSLDKPGLIYALGGNLKFDARQYESFEADDDGIVPSPEGDWGFADDAANKFAEFLKVIGCKEHLEQNLQFIAGALSPNGRDQSRDVIRRYLSASFYRHHLTTYKRRPIYWLFSSGKHRAFQCLVYLHRYNEGTLARMRTEYVIPLQGKMTSRIEQIESEKVGAVSTSQRKNLQKEQDDLKKQQFELRIFEEKLKHFADQKISLDLDDGVKVNYGKFGDLLAEVKAITGGKDDE
jgi:hypothetical protein